MEAPMKIAPYLPVIVVFICLMASSSMGASPLTPIHIYLDADMTSAKSSTVSIERGIRTALAEGIMGGRQVELIVLDHRGNSTRSLANLKIHLADHNGLAVFAGLHSPPLLAHRQFIYDNHILNLKQPVLGLIKTYDHPFSTYAVATPDAHEALGAEDFTFGKYGKYDAITLVKE